MRQNLRAAMRAALVVAGLTVVAVFFGAIWFQHPLPPSLGPGEFEGGEVAKAARAEFCRKYLTPDDPRAWRWSRCPAAVGE